MVATGGGRSVQGPVVEVTFAVSDPRYPFVGVSEAEGCQVELVEMLPRADERYAAFFQVAGADPQRVLELASEYGHVDPSDLARRENGGLFEFVVSGRGPARHLSALGAFPREVSSTDGAGRIVAEVLPGYDAAAVVEAFLDDHSSAKLIAKLQKAQLEPLFTRSTLEWLLDERLTDRQQEVLRAAYEVGYYSRPRAKTGEEIATDLGISSATFSQHIRAAERNFLAILYDEGVL